MSSGLYSGVSGIALGTGLYRNVSGLWGGASGLDAGFAGGSPYSGASLYLDFLTMTAPTFDSRITFSRGTNATLTDSTGRITYAPANLLVRSQEFDNASWGKTDATVTANTAVAPDGTLTADTLTTTNTSNPNIQQSITGPQTGLTFMFSAWVRAGNTSQAILQLFVNSGVPSGTITVTGGIASGPGAVDLSSAASGSVRVTGLSTTEWTRVYVIGTPTATAGSLTAYIKNRLSGGQIGDTTFVWGAQLEQVTYQTTPSTYVATTSAAYYGPRFDYDPVTLAARGLLIEEQRSNLLVRSEEFDNASWNKTRSSVSANATASPSGVVNADKLVENTDASTTHGINQVFTGTAASHTFTVYAKAGERSQIRMRLYDGTTFVNETYFNLATGAVGAGTGGTITNAGNGWYRCSVTGTLAASAGCQAQIFLAVSGSDAYTGDGTSGAFIWGAQIELGAFATSYIPTVASTATRNADVATMTGTNFSTWYNQSEGTFVMNLTPRGVPAGAANMRFLEVNDGTGNNRNPLMYATPTGQAFTQYRVATVDQANLGSAAGYFAANTTIAISTAYATNDFASSFSGGTVQTDTSGSVVSGATQMTIGYATSAGAGSEVFCGHLRTIVYFNTRLPNTQLQTLTT